MSRTIEQALIVHLKLDEDGVTQFKAREVAYEVEDALSEVVAASGAGVYEGHEFRAGHATLFMYGPDADELADAAIPVVQRHRPAAGSYALKRYGPAGSREERVEL